MTDSRMWVPVSVAANILKVSRNTVMRKAKKGDLLHRKVGGIQVSRASICRLCLKESFPEIKEYPLNCDTCQYFKTLQNKV